MYHWNKGLKVSLNEIKTLNSEQVAELYIDEFGNSKKYPGMVFETSYISGYNVNSDTIGEGKFVIKRVR